MTATKFPSIALGTWSWGAGNNGGDEVFGNHLTEKELQPLVDKAMKSPFRLWDTAPVYGHGSSEKILGNLLAAYDRSDYLISTKFTPQLATDSDHAMEEMLADSLRRLQTDYVDMYWIHNPADVEKWTPQLIPLVKSGKVKQVGVSNHSLAQIKRVEEILNPQGVRLAAIQNHYSLLYRSSEEAGILAYCKEKGMTFYSYMVIEQGALTGKYNRQHPLPQGSDRAKTYNPLLQQIESLTDLMNEIGEKHQASVAEIATAWAIAKGTLPIIGVTKAHYIDSEIKAVAVKLTTTEINALEERAKTVKVDTRAVWEESMN